MVHAPPQKNLESGFGPHQPMRVTDLIHPRAATPDPAGSCGEVSRCATRSGTSDTRRQPRSSRVLFLTARGCGVDTDSERRGGQDQSVQDAAGGQAEPRAHGGGAGGAAQSARGGAGSGPGGVRGVQADGEGARGFHAEGGGPAYGPAGSSGDGGQAGLPRARQRAGERHRGEAPAAPSLVWRSW